MPDNNTELDQMQATYVAAVEQWIDAIGQEEALASVNHTIAKWTSGRIRTSTKTKPAIVKDAKRRYEDALRQKFFNF